LQRDITSGVHSLAGLEYFSIEVCTEQWWVWSSSDSTLYHLF